MKRAAARSSEPGAVRLMEEALALLRRAPLETWLGYYLGTLPFVLGLLYFWADMSRGAYARERCAPAALGLAALFLAMKTAQAWFADRLLAQARHVAPSAWSPARWWRTALTQTMLQPLGLLALPAALLLLQPFAWVYAFFQHLTVLGTGEALDLSALLRRAREQTVLWARQNHLVVWWLSPWLLALAMLLAFGTALFLMKLSAAVGHWEAMQWFVLGVLFLFLFCWPCSPLGCVLALNVGALVILLPLAVRTLLGVETEFARGWAYGVMNTTFLVAVYAGVYLLMDPALKAAYVLRTFYGEALRSGADLDADLTYARAQRGVSAALALVVVWLGLGTLTAWAATAPAGRFAVVGAAPPRGDPLAGRRTGVRLLQQETVGALAENGSRSPAISEVGTRVPAETLLSEPELDRAITAVLDQPLYRWRMPRVNPTPALKETRDTTWEWIRPLREFFAMLARQLDKFSDWVERFWRSLRRDEPRDPAAHKHGFDGLYALLFVVTAVVVSVLAIFLWRQWRRPPREAAAPAEALPEPDLTREEVDAAAKPTDEWLALAAELGRRGEWRLALRALFLSGLAWLAQGDLIRLARFKSNRDYVNEVRRQAGAEAPPTVVFMGIVRRFEYSWYGAHPATEALVREATDDLERLRGRTQTKETPNVQR